MIYTVNSTKEDLPVTLNILIGLPIFTSKDSKILMNRINSKLFTYQRVGENSATLHVNSTGEYTIYHIFLQ